MKKKRLNGGAALLLLAVLMLLAVNLHAQEDESSGPFSAGGDLVSSYLWRGTKYGTGPAIQPYLELAIANFSIGGWGSYCFSRDEAAEADLYLSYGFDFGLSIGITDYYFPGLDYFDYSRETGSHSMEINLGYQIKGFTLSANYILNEAGSAGSNGGDMYFEAAFDRDTYGFFMGAGNGWHTVEAAPEPGGEEESDFNICNIGIRASKHIELSESYSLPLSAALIFNPDNKQFHVVVGISF